MILYNSIHVEEHIYLYIFFLFKNVKHFIVGSYWQGNVKRKIQLFIFILRHMRKVNSCVFKVSFSSLFVCAVTLFVVFNLYICALFVYINHDDDSSTERLDKVELDELDWMCVVSLLPFFCYLVCSHFLPVFSVSWQFKSNIVSVGCFPLVLKWNTKTLVWWSDY